mgnify:FL=1
MKTCSLCGAWITRAGGVASCGAWITRASGFSPGYFCQGCELDIWRERFSDSDKRSTLLFRWKMAVWNLGAKEAI